MGCPTSLEEHLQIRSQFEDAIRELEQEASMISFETEDILQQVNLNFENHETSNIFGWPKWVTPILTSLAFGLTGMILWGIF